MSKQFDSLNATIRKTRENVFGVKDVNWSSADGHCMSAQQNFVHMRAEADRAKPTCRVEPGAVHLATVSANAPFKGRLSIVRTTPKRRLATLLAADVVGYSRLMQDDDVGTLETLNQRRARMRQISTAHQGRVVNTPGDAILVEFSSAVEALTAAIEMQEDFDFCNDQLPTHKRMVFRMGMDLGDILVESDGSVYGNGVNIAARMEALAQPGGIVVSGKVFDEVSFRLPQRFHALGQKRVKNIRGRVRAYETVRPAIGRAYGSHRRLLFEFFRDLANLTRGVLVTVAGKQLTGLYASTD